MKQFLFTFTLMSAFVSYGQTWHSLPHFNDTLGVNWAIPTSQFEFNPYSNTLWFIGNNVSVIENNGTHDYWNSGEELGLLGSGVEVKFVFASNHIYYAKDWEDALYTFDNYLSLPVAVGLNNYLGLYHNSVGDTLYLTFDGYAMKKYTEFGGLIQTNWTPNEVVVKNNWLYTYKKGISTIGYYDGPNINNGVIISSDQEYLGGNVHDITFTPNTDSLFVATQNGISIAYAYDFVDNFSPSNTLNMPSANVLEIDFNPVNNDLWATFGDVNDDAIAVAKLAHGDSIWTSIFNTANSPINFESLWGTAIDTLGNIYFCDNFNLHTLSSPNNPQWVKLDELSPSTIAVFPNPAKETVQISIQDNLPHAVALMDINGKRLSTHSQVLNTLTLNLSKLEPGVYFLQVDHQWMEKIMVE